MRETLIQPFEMGKFMGVVTASCFVREKEEGSLLARLLNERANGGFLVKLLFGRAKRDGIND